MVVHQSLKRQAHIQRADKQIEAEKQKVPLILHTDTIVHPRTVMIHHEDASITSAAMVSPCRFNLITQVTALLPEMLKFSHRLVTVPQKSFHVC